ncbi:hypothetical protein DRO97_02450 [Archaeoglobales archaeon]|nr:MAG: hypothetical protein DRO97_02450 [Archaeoglobales archaeon]
MMERFVQFMVLSAVPLWVAVVLGEKFGTFDGSLVALAIICWIGLGVLFAVISSAFSHSC